MPGSGQGVHLWMSHRIAKQALGLISHAPGETCNWILRVQTGRESVWGFVGTYFPSISLSYRKPNDVSPACLLQCLVIPTDEELSIAQQTLEVVRAAGKGAARV